MPFYGAVLGCGATLRNSFGCLKRTHGHCAANRGRGWTSEMFSTRLGADPDAPRTSLRSSRGESFHVRLQSEQTERPPCQPLPRARIMRVLHWRETMASRLLRTDPDFAALFMRLALGLVMFPHGAQKELGLFGGYGANATIQSFTKMGL